MRVERFVRRMGDLPIAKVRRSLRVALVYGRELRRIEGLVTIDRPVAGGEYALRVTYPHADLPYGITRGMRDGIPGEDDALWEEALRATLPDLDPPKHFFWRALPAVRLNARGAVAEGGAFAMSDGAPLGHPWRTPAAARAEEVEPSVERPPPFDPDARALAWLARPGEALPAVASPGAFVIADALGFVVVPVSQGRAEPILREIARCGSDERTLTFFWDGARLYDVRGYAHPVQTADQPMGCVTVPVAVARSLDVRCDEGGSIDV